MTNRIAVLALLSAGALAAGTITTYTDQASFLAAAQVIPNSSTEIETFDSGAITAPDLSVSTESGMGALAPFPGYGRITDGTWNDCIGRPCVDPAGRSFYYNSTTWLLAKPTFAFGATFSYDPITDRSPGISFLPLNDAEATVVAPLSDGFFGFISAVPFDQIYVADGPGQWGDSNQQYYTMDNLYVQVDPPASDAPEPASVGLFALALAGMGFAWRKRAIRR